MKAKRWAAMCSAAVFLLSGCNGVKAPRDLIAAPSLEKEEQKEISDLLKQRIQSNAELLVPRYGWKDRSIYMEDMDGDGKKEGIVFFQAGQRGPVQMAVFKMKAGGWEEAASISLGSRSLNYFQLADLDRNGTKEAVVGMEKADYANEKQLLIYDLKSSKLEVTASVEYEGLDVADYDGDQVPDLLIVTGKRREEFKAGLYSIENGVLELRSATKMNAFAFHQKMEGGTLQDGRHAFFADSKLGIRSMLTEIVAYRAGRLELIGKENSPYFIPSRDINQDGVTEAGGAFDPNGKEKQEEENVPLIEYYDSFSVDGKSKRVMERYKDQAGRFFIIIPAKWYGKVAVQADSRSVQLRERESNQLLFEIKWAGKNESNENKNVLKETKNTVYYTDEKTKQKMPLENFRLMESEF
ncbi:VCBS repeat-containing protein [Metabacillus sp. GX 13764]|uniref:FG-GAP repeat domain-containing protein n=1 Tax=Metabacillus kandeliae TaxID=2900151 RepID=UPI001E5B9269|nr:VCBS repeat-containing protein [Metabacillus kandeliae]MCD7035420.1 VCBS repeat-containing protein [Metabacillus kandeliae]